MYTKNVTITKIMRGSGENGDWCKLFLTDFSDTKVDKNQNPIKLLEFGAFVDPNLSLSEGQKVHVTGDLVRKPYKDREGNWKESLELLEPQLIASEAETEEEAF